ncbi:myeloid-associated differentiation marker-like protein 2 [Myxocyprinus asiaticus]|uniref:myeloid-associated differentiation marker-like protein 2 n=1 Tax=Myxocyprinus asiaticus TaxID=70543 RepID=UPI0022231A1C|nr:myeloid-associated differentiation marker-like protein 2 [Myxocyprinus asiaticus]
MVFFGFSLSEVFKILEMIFCALALLFRGSMSNLYGIWCELICVFGLILALVVFLIEKHLVSKLIELLVLHHSWDELTCGLTPLTSLMLLPASLIYCSAFVCATCIADIICAIATLLAFGVYAVEAVLSKLKCPPVYLSNGRGILRFSQAFVTCLSFAAVYSYFKGVENQFRPFGLIWFILVYVVCFPPSVAIILTHLQKCVDLNKLELVIDIVAVVLYVSMAILWPVFGYKNYKEGNPTDSKTHYSFHDLNMVTVLTYVNLGLYVADLIWTLSVLYQNR